MTTYGLFMYFRMYEYKPLIWVFVKPEGESVTAEELEEVFKFLFREVEPEYQLFEKYVLSERICSILNGGIECVAPYSRQYFLTEIKEGNQEEFDYAKS